SRGVLVQTSRLDSVQIDPETRLATVGAGGTWGAVYEAASPHCLTPITGSSPGVGAVGLVLGGGIGPLSRPYGFASDYARQFQVVLHDGTAVTVTKDQEPELFWALRGGKGGFGVVTSMTVELVPQST